MKLETETLLINSLTDTNLDQFQSL